MEFATKIDVFKR